MTVKSCMRTLVDDTVRFMALCETVAALAALVFAATIVEQNDVFGSGDWKRPARSWFVCAVAGYGAVMLAAGCLGMCGSLKCKGFCLDLHALLTILVVSFELVLLSIYLVDRTALEDLGGKDPYGDLTSALRWVEGNRVGSMAIAVTLFSVQVTDFLLAWSVRICCSGREKIGTHEEFEEFEYEYAPLPPNQQDFQFSSYEQNGPSSATRSISDLQKKYKETFNVKDPTVHDDFGKPLLGAAAATAVPVPLQV
ncbi:hypothetical protein HOP50_03g25190 [Chloropicon primus]|uniref:Tetraspanin n=1 Tax=Chloropicon primus TaxID=1764295 RepID=A0A5B8MI80_9CHLO|nr:hypothetical protein A3770_03p25190 [Chloropicon primus]UPQ99212.1 hypothetical protein HOP50_03g25190 [Chloropicon primus]|eukprot:QDZ20001.1 hypothetical protein A3770_03p25190 [Chloropicon primus]